MEELLHYVWKHKLFPLAPLTTTDGKSVEVVDVGLHNRHAGPDFFNAKVRIDGTLWVGNVEIHDKASDWFVHGHDRDARYDNVVLHVVDIADVVVRTSQGATPPQMVLHVPDRVRDHYQELLAAEDYPPCHAVISSLPRLTVCSWLSALQTERLEQKTEAISDRVKACEGSWEAAYFVTLARNFGFGVNGDIFELWARSIPLGSVDTTVTTSSRWKLSSSDRPDCSIPQSCPRGVVRLRTRIPTSSGYGASMRISPVSFRSVPSTATYGVSCACVRRIFPLSASSSSHASITRGAPDCRVWWTAPPCTRSPNCLPPV